MTTDKRTSRKDVEFSYYVVGYFDLLSQRDWLHEMERLPSSPEEKARFAAAALKTVGAVEHFRDRFQEWCDGMRKPLPDPPAHASPEDIAAAQDLLTTNIRMRPFSDALLVSTCLYYGKAAVYPRVFDVMQTIVGAAMAFFWGFLRKDVFRGGIDIGVGTQLHDGDVYGPVLVDAYRLEQSVAQWPRIVVGNGLVQYLREAVSEDPGDEIGKKLCRLAKICRELIDIDEDGQWIVDYLGLPMRKFLVGDEAVFASAVRTAYEFISSEHKRFSKDGNHKLALRYALLRRYFLDNCGDILESHS